MVSAFTHGRTSAQKIAMPAIDQGNQTLVMPEAQKACGFRD